MYISKMVFIDKDTISEDVLDCLNKNVILTTDYGTDEITDCSWQEFVEQINSYDLGELTLRQIKESLGADVTDLLEKGELDFIMFV